MTTPLPGYDAWKLASPPEYEESCECPPDEECQCCERDPYDDGDYALDMMRDREADRGDRK